MNTTDTAPSSVAQRLAALQADFDLLEGWEERYGYIIELGRSLPPMDPVLKTDHAKVDGCMSQVWLVGHVEHAGGLEVLRLIADSDAVIVRGLIALLVNVYDGAPLEAVRTTDIREVFDTLNLGEHVSMNRRNGFFAMVERIRAFPDRLQTAS